MGVDDGQPSSGGISNVQTKAMIAPSVAGIATHSYLVVDNEDDVYEPRPTKKRKSASTSVPSKHVTKTTANVGKVQQKQSKGKEVEEKRLRRFRTHAPVSFKNVLERAVSQRMFVLERKRGGTPEEPEEVVEIAGTTGNLYTVVISKLPSCTCPHARKGNQCKHIVYVLDRTLKAPSQLQYQLAFLSSEIREIFAHAPAMPSEKGEDTSGLRKPVEDDCPICCCEFDAEHEQIVWCKAACGNNIHKGCFEQWAAQKRLTGGGITCPFCRSQWQGDTDMLSNISKESGKLSADGYVNVAQQLGLSGKRDYSTYHQFWVNRQRRAGLLDVEDEDASYEE